MFIKDVVKIFNNLEKNTFLYKRLMRLDIIQFPKSLAVDSERNAYLFLLPSESREESIFIHYFLYYLNHHFEIRKLNIFSNHNEVSFNRLPISLNRCLSKMEYKLHQCEVCLSVIHDL